MILYLGLDPSRYEGFAPIWHYPLIRTEKLASPFMKEALAKWPFYTHVIFTSRTAVHYWFEEARPGTHLVFAVGKGTALALEERGVAAQVAKEETQEGVMALLDSVEEAHIFWPRSSLARSTLEIYLQRRGWKYDLLDLYTTVFQPQEKITDWSKISEIVFTSPSTVRAFFQLYEDLPEGVLCRALGPQTQKAFATFQQFTYNRNKF